jgi:hypothetical protein
MHGAASALSGTGAGSHIGYMKRKGFEGESGPATLGSTANAHLLLRVWCEDCRHMVDLDPNEQAERHGSELDLLVWGKRLVCSKCGSRRVDSIVAPGSTGGVGK